MAAMTTIRVDRDVYRELEKRVQSFADTPNLVLRRLLGLDQEESRRIAESAVLYRPGLTGFRRGRPASQQRTFTAQREFTRPILEALNAVGGEATAKSVLDEVGRRLAGRLTSRDQEELSNGEPRWRVTAAFERKNLVERGLLDADAPRGIWRITDDGRSWLEGQGALQSPQGWDLELGLKVTDRVMRENRQWLQEMANR